MERAAERWRERLRDERSIDAERRREMQRDAEIQRERWREMLRDAERDREMMGDAETHIERHAVRCRERSSVGGRELVLS